MRKILIFSCVIMVALIFSLIPVYASPQTDDVTVYMNGEKMEFDVPPVIINDRTMVPMRAIFEKLGCIVAWDDSSQQAIGFKNGKKVVVSIGNNTAYVDGKFQEIDQPPVLLNDRTLVPLRFVSEAYGCEVGWDDATQTVTIINKSDVLVHHLDALSFGKTGDWARDGSALKGRTTRDSFWEQGITDIPVDDSAIAEASVHFTRGGKYRIWVLARDFKTNQQGSRFFTIGVDDKTSEKTFGQHGQEGFVWEDAGVFEIAEGKHQIKLIDTSAFFARCDGVFITSDLNFEPQKYASNLSTLYPTSPSVPTAPISFHPSWTKQIFEAEKTDAIENGNYRIEFYQGQGINGPLVQTAIYTKDNGNCPGSGDDGSLCIVLSQQLHGSIQLLLRDGIGTGQDDGGSRLDLVVVELTEVLAVDLHLTGVNHSYGVTQGHFLVGHLVHSTDDIGQLANAGGLNQNPVRMVLVNHLLQSLAEVAHQGAADAAGVHLGDVDAGILQETAVNADLAEFVLNQNQLLTGIGLFDHFLNEGGLACTQEATVNINFGHSRLFPSKS